MPREPRRPVDGVLLLDKPSGLTSNAALQRAKRLYRAEKAGHTGTLDPLASGLLPLCFGEATKFAQRLLDAPKGYVATIRFGATTTTGDAEGEPVRMRPVAIDRASLESALKRFVGPQSQLPPMHSALKFQGRAYYDYARKGEDVPRTPRAIVVHALELVEWSSPDAVVSIACSKGTYVRVLAEDLGEALGCGAHLAALRRTATGGFRLQDALTLDALEAMEDARRLASLLPAAALVADLPRLDVGEAQCRRLRQGQALPASGLADGDFAVFEGAAFVGLAEVSDGIARPRRLVVERVEPA
ncbi:MAG TPA: tRNA pseudouridine(55) synthase TruB [Stellaceae bacterium]|nr:tRNA pseudouridine(55) synthase TruB [Stellaceae bacterium]